MRWVMTNRVGEGAPKVPQQPAEVSKKGEAFGKKISEGLHNISVKLHEFGEKIRNMLSGRGYHYGRYEGFAWDSKTAIDLTQKSIQKHIININSIIRRHGSNIISPELQKSIRKEVDNVKNEFDNIKVKLSEILPKEFKELETKLKELTENVKKGIKSKPIQTAPQSALARIQKKAKTKAQQGLQAEQARQKGAQVKGGEELISKGTQKPKVTRGGVKEYQWPDVEDFAEAHVERQKRRESGKERVGVAPALEPARHKLAKEADLRGSKPAKTRDLEYESLEVGQRQKARMDKELGRTPTDTSPFTKNRLSLFQDQFEGQIKGFVDKALRDEVVKREFRSKPNLKSDLAYLKDVQKGKVSVRDGNLKALQIVQDVYGSTSDFIESRDKGLLRLEGSLTELSAKVKEEAAKLEREAVPPVPEQEKGKPFQRIAEKQAQFEKDMRARGHKPSKRTAEEPAMGADMYSEATGLAAEAPVTKGERAWADRRLKEALPSQIRKGLRDLAERAEQRTGVTMDPRTAESLKRKVDYEKTLVEGANEFIQTILNLSEHAVDAEANEIQKLINTYRKL